MRELLILLILTTSIYTQSIYQNIQISGSGGPNELTICINPKNTQQLYAGSNINKFWYSSNGGYNWSPTQTLVSNPYGVWGDPVIVIDTNEHWYFFHLANNPGLPWPAIDRMVCQKTTSFGTPFSNPGTYMLYNPPKLHDKEWAYVNKKAGPTGNWIYCTWTQFDKYLNSTNLDSTHILFGRSTDAGLTWTQVQRINKRGGTCVDGDYAVEGAVPTAGPEGNIYVAWSGPNGVSDFKIFFDRSTDGGVTWLANDIIAANQAGGWDMTIPGINRCNGMPIIVSDVSGGPYNGYIHLVYADQTNGTTDTDIWYVRSTNNGNTWSTPFKVNNDASGKHQFFPWMTVDQVTGYIYCVFYDRRNYTDNQTDVYLAKSTDGGTTWTNERISESPFNPTSGVFIGDYICITAHNNKIRPIWTRLSSGTLSAWTAIIDITVDVENTSNEKPSAYKLSQNYPNPFNPNTRIAFELPSANYVSINVYDVTGKLTAKLTDEYYNAGSYELFWDASSLSSGIYYYTMISGGFKETKKMIITK
jgi:hypothetical protein